MRIYEYTTVHLVPSGAASDLVRPPDCSRLNELGAEGWEAFAAVPAALDGYAYAVTDGVHVLLRRSSVAAD